MTQKRWFYPSIIVALLVAFFVAWRFMSAPVKLAEFKGGQLTEAEFYSQLKKSPATKQALANELIYRALDEKYGKQVSSEAVDKAYQDYKDRYGDAFANFLSDNGYTEESFRQLMRTNLLGEVALKDQIKPTEDQLRTEWQNYQPKVTVRRIQTTSPETANTVLNALKNGGDFAKLAQEYSVDASSSNKGGQIPAFDMNDKNLDSSFKKAAYQLKNGERTTTAVKTTQGYEIIEMVSHPDKGSFDTHKKDLTATFYAKLAQQNDTMRQVIAKVLKDQDVKIEDADLKSALDQYQVSQTQTK